MRVLLVAVPVVQVRNHQHAVQPRSQTSKLNVLGVLGDNDYQVKRLSYKSLAPITPLTPYT